MRGIGGSISKDIEVLMHVKGSYFRLPPDSCLPKPFCKSVEKKAGKNTFLVHRFCTRTPLPLFWSCITKQMGIIQAWKIQLISCNILGRSYVLQVDQGIQVLGKLSSAFFKVSKTTHNFGAFSNRCFKTPGLSQLLLLDTATGDYCIFLIHALI